MRLFDTHCHPQFPQYDEDRDAVIRRALDSGIGMVCVGTDFSTSELAIRLAEQYEGLYASVGLHPNDNLDEAFDRNRFVDLAGHPKVIAIGEIGLDYFRTTDTEKRRAQKLRFIEQLSVARSVMKPVIIHCRDAHEDMIEILEPTRGSVRGVIHSFNGTIEQAKAYIDGGFYIGLNAIVTFSRQYEDMVRSIPLNRLLLETDAPYLAPEPYRGKRNEPSYVDIVAAQIALILNTDKDALCGTTTKNAEALYSM